jgi:hypothetical protein
VVLESGRRGSPALVPLQLRSTSDTVSRREALALPPVPSAVNTSPITINQTGGAAPVKG